MRLGPPARGPFALFGRGPLLKWTTERRVLILTSLLEDLGALLPSLSRVSGPFSFEGTSESGDCNGNPTVD